MGAKKRQPIFSHDTDWRRVHEQMASDLELVTHLKFDGVLVDTEGKPRLLLRCPACGSTFSGPQMPWARVFAFLGEQMQKCSASIDLVTSLADRAESGVVQHTMPTLP